MGAEALVLGSWCWAFGSGAGDLGLPKLGYSHDASAVGVRVSIWIPIVSRFVVVKERGGVLSQVS